MTSLDSLGFGHSFPTYYPSLLGTWPSLKPPCSCLSTCDHGFIFLWDSPFFKLCHPCQILVKLCCSYLILVYNCERLHFHLSLSCIGEGNGDPLQCSCLENPRDRGAWWAASYGVTQSQTRLKWLSISSSIAILPARAWSKLPPIPLSGSGRTRSPSLTWL